MPDSPELGDQLEFDLSPPEASLPESEEDYPDSGDICTFS